MLCNRYDRRRPSRASSAERGTSPQCGRVPDRARAHDRHKGSTVYLGGLVGKNYRTIESSYAISEIKSANITEEKAIGGFTGANFDLGNIKDSYSKTNIENNREAKINLLGGFSGDNLKTISNCYYFANDEIKYSAGESLVFTDIDRVSEEELKTLASSLNGSFTDGSNGYPVLKSEDNI